MNYKESFIKFMVESGVLTFGEFTLKSGRKAPYFVNTGNYNTGSQLARLGEYYAQCIKENNVQADTLFGPAYKGIPLAPRAVLPCQINTASMYIMHLTERKLRITAKAE